MWPFPRDSKTPANIVAPRLTITLSLPHQHGLHGPHLHILLRQPLEAGHQGQPVGLGAATRAPAPVAVGPTPAICPWPTGALAPGVTRAAGRVPLISPAMVNVLQMPQPVFLI